MSNHPIPTAAANGIYRFPENATAHIFQGNSIPESSVEVVVQLFEHELEELLDLSSEAELQFQFNYGNGYFDRLHIDFDPTWSDEEQPKLENIFIVSLPEKALKAEKVDDFGHGSFFTCDRNEKPSSIGYHWEHYYPKGSKRIPAKLGLFKKICEFQSKLAEKHQEYACMTRMKQWQQNKKILLIAFAAIVIIASLYFGVRFFQKPISRLDN